METDYFRFKYYKQLTRICNTCSSDKTLKICRLSKLLIDCSETAIDLSAEAVILYHHCKTAS